MTRTHDDMREKCSCTHEAGDSDCAAHPTCLGCGESIESTALVVSLRAQLTRLTSALAEAERERDEVRAASDRLAIRLDDSAKRNIALHDEIDSLRAQVADLTRERDEARRKAIPDDETLSGFYRRIDSLAARAQNNEDTWRRDTARLRALLGECLDIWRARRAAPPTMSDFAACERLDAISKEAGLNV